MIKFLKEPNSSNLFQGMEQPNIELILGNLEAMMFSSSFIFEEVTEESINNMTEDNIRIFPVWKNNGA